MKLIPSRPLAIAAGLALAAAACGSLSDADMAGTLATVGGNIDVGRLTTTQLAAAKTSAFRVAVVWVAPGQALGDGGYADDSRTTQDIAVTPKFPAEFQLDLSELPNNLQPFQEMFGAPAGANLDLRGAAGYVVAYEDLNHNGKLDLVAASAPGFVDAVLGEASAELLYLQGTMPSDLTLLANAKDTDGHLPALGFNLYESYCASNKAPPSGSCASAFDWVPLSTPLFISLSAAPSLQNVMCQQFPGNATTTTTGNPVMEAPGVFPAQFPLTTDPNLLCEAGGTAYQYLSDCSTTTPSGICQQSSTTCTPEEVSLTAGAAAPSGWPCTVQ
jgi:hypothetical protein